jgi:hypothetical protein
MLPEIETGLIEYFQPALNVVNNPLITRKSPNPEGRPPRYGKTKTRINLTLTQEGIAGLERLAEALELSRSELVERIGRGVIPLPCPMHSRLEEKTMLGKH